MKEEKRDVGLYLEDIIESIKQIQEYTDGIEEDEFYTNQLIQDAVARRFAIIGEAVKHVPDYYREKHSETEWKNIAGMRDILVHEYFEVNLKRVWNTIQEDLPNFKEQIKSLPEMSDS
jgi:uncharacterized protein with HEPN domain